MLGAPRITSGGVTSELLPERRFQLLAYLACRADWTTRDALAGMFWPDRDNAAARRNLRFVIHSIRELPSGLLLEAQRDRVRMQVHTDVAAFEQAVRDARWADAVALYRGPLCAGLDVHASDTFVQWLALERERLAASFHRAAMEHIAGSDPAAAIPTAQRLLELDPADEDALRAWLGALRALGRPHEAKRVYHDFAARLMDELGIEPSAATRALARDLGVFEEAKPQPRTSPASFIGRAQELREIGALLAQPECRLLTLLGAGGVGKSRLAREFAAVCERAPLWIVDLQAVAVPAQVATRTAAVLGIPPSRTEDAVARVAAFIADRSALLVLDQFEHVIDAASVIAQWLVACPRLALLVTSRERLDIAGEAVLPIEGLPFPSAKDDDGEHFDAVRLFSARASAAVPGFDFDAHRVAIGRIVRGVEGMPLAIELAAAWVRYLPCEHIARDLAATLERPDASADDRAEHRSMRASCEYSWQLLTARERTWFARLCVFRGTFSAEAARHVSQMSLPALAGLVDKCLLRAHENGRFGLHPLMQAFVTEKLMPDAAEARQAHERHAEYFSHWLERFGDVRRGQLAEALAAIEPDAENCVAAWRWSVDHQRGDLVRAAAVSLLRFFEFSGRLREGSACFAYAENLDPASVGDTAIGLVLRARATLTLRLGGYDAAEDFARSALHHFRLARDGTGIKGALTVLGLANWERARYAQARPYFLEGLRRARADGDTFGVATFQTNLALIAKASGDYVEARNLIEESIPLYRVVGDEHGLLAALANLGNLYRSLKEPARGRAPLLEALAEAEAAGMKLNLPFILLNLALVELDVGDLDAAAAYAERALAAVRQGGDRQAEIAGYATLARIALVRADAASTRAHLHATALLARQTRHTPHLIGVAVILAGLRALEHDPIAAAAIFLMVRTHPSAGAPDRDEADAGLARVASLLPDGDLALAEAQSRTLDLDAVVARALAASPPPEAV